MPFSGHTTGPNLLKFGDAHPESRVDLFGFPEDPDAPPTKRDLFWMLEAQNGMLRTELQYLRSNINESGQVREEAAKQAQILRTMEETMYRAMALQAAWKAWLDEYGKELSREA